SGPALPSGLPARALFSLADTVKVWCPLGSALESPDVDHAPPLAVVFAFATSVGPSKTCTTTSVFSLAVPENEGFVLFERAGGPTIVTTGGSVSTSKVIVLLEPGAFPMPLISVAYAVNVRLPAGSGGLTPAVLQLPPDAVVFAFATSVGPSKTWTSTSVFSLAVPENDGLVSFERAGGPTIVTVGGSVSTSKL